MVVVLTLLDVAVTWPLTGRAEELSLIGGLLHRRDGPLGVVLAGAAGVGKTRLAREALAVAQQRGAHTWWAAATASARALPLGAFAATLEVVGPDPARLLRQASAALLAGAGRAGVIVGVDDAQHPGWVYLKPEILLAGAWVAAAEGSISEAVAQTHQAAELAAAQDQPAVEVFALHTAVCFGDRTVADRLAQLATEVDGPRAPIAAAHAAALAADDGGALHAASRQLEEVGALLLAADAAAQATVTYTRQGLRGSAQAATTRAHRLAQACEGAHTPALTTLAAPLPLTNREREIVTLAAGGLSKRQIADRLVVSVRTVEGHLYRACAKLGASDRAELATLLRGE
jgi:DNA-binding NarL/FixJ family response regulator